jgi:hypothetical protein
LYQVSPFHLCQTFWKCSLSYKSVWFHLHSLSISALWPVWVCSDCSLWFLYWDRLSSFEGPFSGTTVWCGAILERLFLWEVSLSFWTFNQYQFVLPRVIFCGNFALDWNYLLNWNIFIDWMRLNSYKNYQNYFLIHSYHFEMTILLI